MKNLRKSLASLIIVSMTMTACGKNDPAVNNYYTTNAASESKGSESVLAQTIGAKESKSLTFENCKRLVLTKDKNNYSLAKIFSAHVSFEEKEAVENYINENLSTEEIATIIKRVSANYENKKLVYLYNDAPWAQDQKLIDESIMKLEEITVDYGDLEKQLMVETAIKIKSKYLEEILGTYSKAIDQTSAELAADYAVILKEKQPEVIKKAEEALRNGKKDAAIETLRKGLEKLQEFNQIRQDTDIENSQLVMVGLSGAVAYKIYDLVKDSKTFANVKKIINDAKVLKQKFEDAKKIVTAIKDLHKSMSDEVSNFTAATKKLGEGAGGLISAVKKDLEKDPKNNLTVKEQLDALYKKIKGGSKSEVANGKYKNHLDKMDQGLVAMSSSFSKISENFDAIINSSVQLLNVLGVKIGKDGQKIIKAAKTVSGIISVAANTLKGFATGGYVGAGVALLGSMSSVFGGSSEAAAQAQIMKQLEMMDLKLDEILKLQKETIQLQLETMKMIRDLALMVDEFHQEEMRALSLLRDEGLTNMELAKVELNRNIKQCELLIEYQMANATRQEPLYLFSDNTDLLDITHKNFYGSLVKYQSFESIVRGATFDGFSNCQSGINDAFGSVSHKENPILAIYNSKSDGENNLLRYQREVYAPLFNEFNNSVIGESYTVQLPLHIPVKSMKGLDKKYSFLANPTSLSGRGDNVYNFSNFVSPLALTRYASSLLILYPLLDFDRDTWMQGPNAIVNRFFADLLSIPGAGSDDHNSYLKSRSLYLLKNALRMTQSAIAQEALLSGEPMLNVLYNKRAELFKSENPCTDRSLGKGNLQCAVYSNRLLLKNLLVYSLMKDGNLENYKNVLATAGDKGIPALEQMLGNGSGYFNNKIKYDAKAGYYVELKLADPSSPSIVVLPSAESLKDVPVFYSENMVKLVKLQLKLIDAIIEVSPQFMNDGLDTKYSALILSNTLK